MREWNVRLGKPNGGEMVVSVMARDETHMKNVVAMNYPGYQLRNYSV